MTRGVLFGGSSSGDALRVCTALLLLLAVGCALPGHAQQVHGPEASPAPVAADQPTKPQVPPDVLQELDAMKKRIEQLEGQLKQRSADEPQATATEASKFTSPAVSASTSSSTTTTPVQQALQTDSPPSTKPESEEPFAFADWTWLNGNPRTKDLPFDSKFFTPEIRADVAYHYDFNHPMDDTISGSSEVFRSNELQVTQLGVGGDFHLDWGAFAARGWDFVCEAFAVGAAVVRDWAFHAARRLRRADYFA